MTDIDKRYGNFDALRILCAIAVIFSHAFSITEGSENGEPLTRLLGAGNIFGGYAVFIFFVISGFLITRSFLNTRQHTLFFAKRLLRIFPGLITCVLVISLIIGPFLTSHSLIGYFTSRALYVYLIKTSLIIFFDTSSNGLPGVSFSNNDFGRIINGCTWSLGPEVLCYILTAMLGWLGLLGPIAAAVVLGFGLWTETTEWLGNFGYVLPYYAAGTFLYFVYPRTGWKSLTSLLCGAALVCTASLGYPMQAAAIFGSYLVIAAGTGGGFAIWDSRRVGDLSYGIYLYGWPIEEIVKRFGGDGITWWQTFCIALPIALVVSYLSWHIVEKRALGLISPIKTALGSQRAS